MLSMISALSCLSASRQRGCGLTVAVMCVDPCKYICVTPVTLKDPSDPLDAAGRAVAPSTGEIYPFAVVFRSTETNFVNRQINIFQVGDVERDLLHPHVKILLTLYGHLSPSLTWPTFSL